MEKLKEKFQELMKRNKYMPFVMAAIPILLVFLFSLVFIKLNSQQTNSNLTNSSTSIVSTSSEKNTKDNKTNTTVATKVSTTETKLVINSKADTKTTNSATNTQATKQEVAKDKTEDNNSSGSNSDQSSSDPSPSPKQEEKPQPKPTPAPEPKPEPVPQPNPEPKPVPKEPVRVLDTSRIGNSGKIFWSESEANSWARSQMLDKNSPWSKYGSWGVIDIYYLVDGVREEEPSAYGVNFN